MASLTRTGGWGQVAAIIGGSCLLLLLGAIGFGVIVLGKTGLIGSGSTSEPVRVVETTATSSEVQEALIASALASFTNGELSLVLTDQMLTALVRDGLAQANEDALLVDRAQIAVVSDGYLELFVPFLLGERESTLSAKVYLEVVDGKLDSRVEDVRLGTLTLPWSFAGQASSEAIQAALDTQLERVQGTITLTELIYEDAQVRLVGSIDVF